LWFVFLSHHGPPFFVGQKEKKNKEIKRKER